MVIFKVNSYMKLENQKQPLIAHKVHSCNLNGSAKFYALVCLIASPFVVNAQAIPDAGQILQQQQQAPRAPRQAPTINIQAAPLVDLLPGGQQVTLSQVQFEGNTVFSSEALNAVLGAVHGQAFDMAALRSLANRISQHYRNSGYPFARAFLTEQTLQDGLLRIDIIEGRYGQVRAISDDATLAEQAQPWLAPLVIGSVIDSHSLERATLIMDDLPGITVSPVIRPGEALGAGDLDVRLSRTRAADVSMGYDNHGNRYTGLHRLRANVNINSPFTLGDQIIISALASDMDMALGSVNYSAPLGNSGLRGNVGYSHTQYDLGKDFKVTQSTGTAQVSSVGLSYPIIRSQRVNLTVVLTSQDKRFKDSRLDPTTDTINTERKSSKTMPIALQFDRRDNLGGGGIVFGSVMLTNGRLKVDGDDPNNIRGTFNKFNLDVVRLQAVSSAITFFARLSTQKADKNLDTSEGMSAGGPTSVRAYPSGEWSGDVGWLTQLELRYSMGAYAPYVFYDHSSINANAKGANNTTRVYAGYGAGLRYQHGAWSADLALAWRRKGGRPADGNERDAMPRVWLNAGYRF